MNKVLILAIISGIAITLTTIGLLSLPEQKVEELSMDELIAKAQNTYLYVQQNSNSGFTEREYSAVMRLSNGDPDKAIEIFNDPDYPQKFYDETGYLPNDKNPEMYPEILKRLSDNYSHIKENTNHEFTRDEYSAVMRLSNGDPDKAIEIFNDPGYPEKFYDKNGSLP